MWSPLNTSKPPRGNSHQNTFITNGKHLCFVVFGMQIMNFSGFIGWTHGHFQDETYFTKLRAKKIRLIKLAMALFFYILRDYLFIVLRVEKRKPIHNLLYDLIKQYMDNVKAMKVNVSIESLNNKELCHAQHIYDTWDIMAKKEKESVMDDIHEFTERLGCELDKRFKDSDDSMKLGYH
eukprot:928094_1